MATTACHQHQARTHLSAVSTCTLKCHAFEFVIYLENSVELGKQNFVVCIGFKFFLFFDYVFLGSKSGHVLDEGGAVVQPCPHVGQVAVQASVFIVEPSLS